jgi:uncharacterized membrane protein YdjX (TVP38/TMEM64 family)
MSKAASGFLMMKFKLSRPILIAAAVVIAALFFWLRGGVSLQSMHAWAESMNGFGVFLALTVLPLFGFPVSVLHAVAGARFGMGLGIALVGVSIALQLIASYAIVCAAPDFFARRFDWLRQKLPPATHRTLTLFTMVLPGAPYFAQNYVLAVVGVPFPVYFLYGFLIHFARSLIGVVFGEWSGDMTPTRIGIFAVYGVLITLVCGLAFRRLRDQLKNPPREAGGPKRRG